MSKLRMTTRHLVGMLRDLYRTASTEDLFPEVCTVLLHTERAAIPLETERGQGEDDESLMETVTTDVLVGTSTDRTIVAQAHAPCQGRLHGPVLISAADAKAIYLVFEPLYKAAPKQRTHEVVLEFSGDTLRISEALVEANPVVLSVSTVDQLDHFPRNLADAMDPDPGRAVKRDGQVIARTAGMGIEASHLAALAAVAKRRKMPIMWYVHHQSRPVVVTIGAWYRAAALPAIVDVDDEALDEVLVPVFEPPLPERAENLETEPLVSV